LVARRDGEGFLGILASLRFRVHNGGVPRLTARLVVLTRVLLIVTSVAGSFVAELRSSTAAMACCAKAHSQCAGLSAPDDCCERMGHATAASVAGTLSAAQPHLLPATGDVARLPANLAHGRSPSTPESFFTRPHDPPHLHSFSLLI
jgi:hypothetical protein